jgi:lauroyl/myristoyl acyltransferase
LGGKSRFRIELKEIEVKRTDNRDEDLLLLTTAIFAQFETWIREAPEQWMWWNTRWEAEPEAPAMAAAGAEAPVAAAATRQAL